MGAVMVEVEMDMRPPGLSTLNISLKAFSLFGAKQKAPLEITQSILASSNGMVSISAFTNLTLSDSPLAAARLVAC